MIVLIDTFISAEIPIFILNLKIEEFNLNCRLNIKSALEISNINLLMPAFKIANRKLLIKQFSNELISYYLAHMIVQIPKAATIFNQLKNPLNLVN